MKYAIIRIGGKQIKIKEGQIFEIERQKDLNFDVLAYSDGKKTTIGDPTVSGVKVKATISGEKRGSKIRVARFKSKSRYRKVAGHRQPLSIIKVESITKGAEKNVTKKTPKKTKNSKVKK